MLAQSRRLLGGAGSGDLGGSTEILDSVDGTKLSLPALLCNEPSSQQVLACQVSDPGAFIDLRRLGWWHWWWRRRAGQRKIASWSCCRAGAHQPP